MKHLILPIIIIFFSSSFIKAQHENLKYEAEQYIFAGKLGEAIDLLNKYISSYPGYADGYNLRGQAYEKRGNFEEAVRDYTSASKLEPLNKTFYINLERARMFWNKLLVNRIEGYEREIGINSDYAKNYLEIGKSYKNLEDWPAAELWYDEYLKREEASPDEILRYTEILSKNKKYSKGEPFLKKYTVLFPGDHRLWSRYGYFSLWLGNRKKAIEAFEEALRIRPFFKEAMEGLEQAKGKGYNYTYTTSHHKAEEFSIDRYYKELKSDPGNNTLRLLLVKDLMKHKRFEEAYQQLIILQKDSASASETGDLMTEVLEQRRDIHLNKIGELNLLFNKNKSNREIILQLARRYSYIEEYDSSEYFYKEYLKLNPGDLGARFEYAKVLSWNLNYQAAKDESSLLLSLDPDNSDYRLLFATLSIWMLQDLDKADAYLKSILSNNPYNFEALISSVSLSIENKDFISAESFLQRAKLIDPENERIAKLESDLDFHKLRAEEEKIFQILEAGRVLAMQNDCKGALKLYEEYLPQADPNRMVLKEYADVNACAGNYEKAIKIYDALLAEEYNFETDLERAKVFYWMGDSLKALKEFTRLNSSNPENFDVKMYLGDVYTRLKMYPEARTTFDQMLSSGLDSVQTELINLRKGWLPLKDAAFGSFLKYVMITPSSLYYNDNLEFTYNLQTLRVDLGLSEFMTFAPEAALGFISSSSLSRYFEGLRGNLLFRFTEKLTAGGSAGVILFPDYRESTTAEGFIKYEKDEVYSASVSYSHQDAAFVLYSPFLVNNRLKSDLFRTAGFYQFPSRIKFSGYLNRLDISDNNTGYFLELEAGKYFGRLYAGYEYYNTSFMRFSPYYFSPEHYSSHSIAAEYEFVKEKVNRLSAGGKAGIISNSDYVLKEIFAGGIYSLLSNLALQARISYGTTLQNDLGYSSFSVQVSAYFLF